MARSTTLRVALAAEPQADLRRRLGQPTSPSAPSRPIPLTEGGAGSGRVAIRAERLLAGFTSGDLSRLGRSAFTVRAGGARFEPEEAERASRLRSSAAVVSGCLRRWLWYRRGEVDPLAPARAWGSLGQPGRRARAWASAISSAFSQLRSPHHRHSQPRPAYGGASGGTVGHQFVMAIGE